MSFLFGSLDPSKGSQFEAQGLQPGQLNQAYQNTQQGLAEQQAFLNSLGAQGGIANQSNVFAQQQALANQLQGVASGTGPNPALAQLANTTGQNVAQQAALMAGQRGASQNPGLIARQIGQQGAQIQQNSAGQAAALSAQQQLAGLGALQAQQGMLGNLATQQVGQQQNALGLYNQAAQGQQANLNSLQANQNSTNAGVANTNAQTQGKMTGGLFNGVAGALAGLAHGGMVKNYDQGGSVEPPAGPNSATGPRSFMHSFLSSLDTKQAPGMTQDQIAQDNWNQGFKNLGSAAGKGLEALFGSGPAVAESAAAAGPMASSLGQLAVMAPLLSRGGPVSGEALGNAGKKVPGKAKVSGDSLKNDTVDAKLSPGEIVIPRSHAMDPEKAAAFARAVVMRNQKRAA